MVCTIRVPRPGPQEWECSPSQRTAGEFPLCLSLKEYLSGYFIGYPLQYSCLENSVERGAWAGYSPWGHKESDTTEHRMHIRYFVECPSICLVIRLQFQILGKNTTEVMCPARGLVFGTA